MKQLTLIFGITILIITASCINIKKMHTEDMSRQFLVNKNYMFCICLNTINYQNNLSDYFWHDGSIEIYFIDTLLVIDVEDAKEFVQAYLDSLDAVNAYRSYNNSTLGVGKCLEIYNSKSLHDFIFQSIKRDEEMLIQSVR